MQPLTDQDLTVEDLYDAPDDGYRYELQAGLLIAEPLPGFRHGAVMITVGTLLGNHAKRHQLGAVVAGDSGFILARKPDTVRGPDVAFVSKARLDPADDHVRAFVGAPDLAVEILSPSNTPAAIHAKVGDYLAAGTRRVWVVDPERRTVTVYATLLSPRVLSESELLEGEDVVPGFSVRVAELFEL